MLDGTSNEFKVSTQDQREWTGPRPDSVDADRLLIKRTAAVVADLLPGINAAKRIIASGREFGILHDALKQNHPRDKSRIGWRRAFSKSENRFGLSRRTAETHITIHDAFFATGNVLPVAQLPQSLRPLYLLAKLGLQTDRLLELVTTGSIGPMSSEAEIRRLGIRLGLVEVEKSKPVQIEIEAAETKPDLVATYEAANKEERGDLFIRMAVEGLLTDLPESFRSGLADRLVGQQARSASSSTNLAVKCTGLLKMALLKARDGNTSEAVAALNNIIRKLEANGRDLNAAFIAIGAETKRKSAA